MIIQMYGKDYQSQTFRVRCQAVADALQWLVVNNPIYKHITIDQGRIYRLPEDGLLEFRSKISSKSDSKFANDITDDLGSSNDTLYEEKVYDENTELSSFVPVPETYNSKQDNIIKSELLTDSHVNPIKIGDTALNEFTTDCLATMAFPILFPDSKGDPTNNDNVRDLAKSATESFAMKLKHLLKFAEFIDGKWTYRFASHPRFAYWAYNMLYRWCLLGQSNIFIKQNPGDAALTTEQLTSMLLNNDHHYIMSKLFSYAKKVSGTNAYWNNKKQHLQAIIEQKGPPTIFWTLSCADFHWPEFHSLFCGNNLQSSEFRSNVINNPHVSDWLFTKRVERFVKWWLYKSLGASWHWYRFEFAVQRGSIHCHGVAKLKDDPGLCQLTQIALKGFLAKQAKDRANSEGITIEQLQQEIDDGLEAESIVSCYVDSLMSTWNPNNPEEMQWIKPDIHPCRKRFQILGRNNRMMITKIY